MPVKIRPVLFVVWLLLAAGCTSIRTSLLDRNPCGGWTTGDEVCLKGVPVLLRVPTHLEVRVYERDYWYVGDNYYLQRVRNAIPVRWVASQVQQSEQLFLIDPKRPAAGTGVYGFTFTSSSRPAEDAGHGYLQGVTYKADDQTLARSASLLASMASMLAAPAPAGLAISSMTKGVQTLVPVTSTDRVVAWRRFALNDLCVDEQVSAFLDLHVNQAPLEPQRESAADANHPDP